MNSREIADVLVVGSGAAGAALTKRLTDRGAKVVCLEQGDWRKASDYPSSGSDYEGQMQRPQFSFSPNVRMRPEDYAVKSAGKDPPDIEMVNGVGGTTVHWACEFLRLHRSDFRVHALDGVGEDWPIRYEDIEPYYNLNDEETGVSGVLGDPMNPIHASRLPPFPLGAVGRSAARAFNKLGWHWWPLDVGFLSRPYDGRPACDFSAQGWYGCGAAARAGTDVTYWPKALARGAVLKVRCRVREIEMGPAGKVVGAIYYDEHGGLHRQLANAVVVCANGIGTPRLLLNSKSKYFPNGLANSSGLVGKGCMLHVGKHTLGVLPECLDSHLHPTYTPLISQQFYETDPHNDFARGVTLLVRGLSGPLNTALSTDVPWGRDHHQVMKERFPHLIFVTVLGEDLRVETNCVELDADTKDSNGIPVPRVTYTIPEPTRKLVEFGGQRARDMLQAAGATKIIDDTPYTWTSHFMGTVRMGNNPRHSVVNRWHQAHDVQNLFVVDGSSFVSSGAVGPTPTIGALALRCADAIWERRRDLGQLAPS